MTHTEPRCSVCSLPEHRRNRPPRRRFVIRHRCHFVKQRLCLATQTTEELTRIERTASAKTARRPIGNEPFACRATRLERCRPTRKHTPLRQPQRFVRPQACQTSMKHPSATALIVSPDWQPAESYPPSMNAKFDSKWQSRPPNQAKFVAIGRKLV